MKPDDEMPREAAPSSPARPATAPAADASQDLRRQLPAFRDARSPAELELEALNQSDFLSAPSGWTSRSW